METDVGVRGTEDSRRRSRRAKMESRMSGTEDKEGSRWQNEVAKSRAGQTAAGRNGSRGERRKRRRCGKGEGG